MLSLNKKQRKEKGQGMTEYIIIVVLIALTSIAVVGLFGDQLRNLFGNAANELGDGGATITDVDNTAIQDASDSKGISDVR